MEPADEGGGEGEGMAESLEEDTFFVKTRGGVESKGTFYENYMFILLVFRLLEGKDILDFYIAKNVDNVGNFDDIVLKVTYKESSEDKVTTKFIFIQLKHKETVTELQWNDVLRRSGGYFCLEKYFNEYKLLLERLGNFKDPILDTCIEEDIILVIYTNTNFIFQRNTVSSQSTWRRLLETDESATVFNFCDDEEYFNILWSQLQKVKHEIYKDNNETKFLQKLVFFSGQNNESQIYETLNDKLKKYIIGSALTSADALERILKFMKNKSNEWLNPNRGALHNITVNYQGISGQMHDIFDELKLNKSIFNKIIVKNMCLDKNSTCVEIGNKLPKSESYFIERKVWHKKEKQSMQKMMNSQIVLLSAGPGMGKSCFLTNRAEIIKKKNPEKLVIRENLVDHSKYLSELEINNENKKNIAANFLQQLAKVLPEGTIEFDLFHHCLNENNKMVCFLDGVDEISPHYFKEILAIIQTILTEFKVQIWVSTRLVTQKKLEKGLRVISWKLDSFTREDWDKFLMKYCGIQYYHVGHIAKALRKIPLFCKMLGDIIKSEQTESNSQLLSAILDECELYDRFTDVMYKVYYQNAGDTFNYTPAGIIAMEKSKKSIMQQHEVAALLEVLPSSVLEKLDWGIEDLCEDFFKDLKKGVEKAGFILNIIEGKPKFMHRSIAEYFAGRWFARNLKKFKEYDSKYGDLDRNITYFMAQKLPDSDEIFKKTLILMLNKKKLMFYLEENKNKFNMKDVLGRNLLYYVDLAYITKAFKYIMVNGFQITEENIRTRTFMRGLHHTIFVGNILARWLHSLVIKSECDISRLQLIIFAANTSTFEYYNRLVSDEVSVHYLILSGQYNKFEEELNSNNINSRNPSGFTPLHLAAFMNAIDVVKLLRYHGANYCNKNQFGVFPHHCAIRINLDTTEETNKELSLFNCGIDPSEVPNPFTPLHAAAQGGEFSQELYNNLLLQENINYVVDEFGFYPHSYSKIIDEIQLLKGFGFACTFQGLSWEDQMYLGVNVVEIIKECDAEYFIKGLEARLFGKTPFEGNNAA